MPFTHRRTLLALVGTLVTAAAAGAQQAPPASLSATARTAVLDSVRKLLRSTYVDADTGRMIAAQLSARQTAHAYDTLAFAASFASAVTGDLRSINHDKHLVLIAPRPQQGAATPGDPGSGEPRVVIMQGHDEASAARRNFGLRKVEVFDGNIGYLEVADFAAGPGVDAAIGDALRLLERTDAIIIDIRRNGGGSGEMSHMLFSHFLPATPVPTIRVRDRTDGGDTILTSVANVTGPRRTAVPLYVLTSHFSASAAEEFAFVLRNKGRATIVGERTAGAGHMNQVIDVGHGFRLSVSYTRVSDPVTGAEWEQVGVTPTIATDAASALDVALQHARRSVAQAR